MRKAVVLLLVATMLLVAVNTASAGKTMDSILNKGELVVGITGTQPPLNVTNKDGKIIGYDADIAKLIAMNLGVTLKFSTMPFAELLPALSAGKVDMILSSMTMTLERNRKVAFIGPYYVSGKGILTKTQTIGALQQAAGLNNPEFTVAALKNSTSQAFVEKTAPKAQLVPTNSYDEAIEMLLQDKVTAIVADYPFCAFSAFRHQDKDLVSGQSKLTIEPLGIAIREDALLINWLSNFVNMLEFSGQIKKLTEKWFQSGAWIKELPSE
jgi:polar amino acid transport system substrate-binding protein